MNPVLSIEDLSFSYRSYTERESTPLFEHLTLSIQPGERVLLLAPFNQGKTTLAKIICGVCPKYFPGDLQGRLTLCGTDVRASEPWDLLKLCGYVSQNPQEQFIATSVEEELAFPLESLGLERDEIAQRIENSLTRWGLGALRSASGAELSGGERKRVLLAVQEAIDPELWLLDEPFDDLDVVWREQLRTLIAEGKRTYLVLASRYLTEFEGLFDRIVLLEDRVVTTWEHDLLLARFEEISGDDLPNPLEDQSIPTHIHHTLNCDHLTAVRRRHSIHTAEPFTIEAETFELQSGELITLSGPNGSGKSSFSRLLCGLDEAVSGQIRVDGNAMTARQLNRQVGYLFQSPDLQIFLPTVEEELSWSLKRRVDLDERTIAQRVGSCAERFGLTLTDTPATMSYPLRKALQAAVYYLLERPFYILDELDSALTYHAALSIIARLREGGAGILLITHDRRFAARVSERGYAMDGGRVVRL